MGSNMFSWISQNFHIFFAETFCADSTAIALSCQLEHIGASRWILAPLGPPEVTHYFGDKHTHHSDHAECMCVIVAATILGLCVKPVIPALIQIGSFPLTMLSFDSWHGRTWLCMANSTGIGNTFLHTLAGHFQFPLRVGGWVDLITL